MSKCGRSKNWSNPCRLPGVMEPLWFLWLFPPETRSVPVCLSDPYKHQIPVRPYYIDWLAQILYWIMYAFRSVRIWRIFKNWLCYWFPFPVQQNAQVALIKQNWFHDFFQNVFSNLFSKKRLDYLGLRTGHFGRFLGSSDFPKGSL